MPGWNQSFYKVAACAMVLLGLASCSGGGSSGGSTTAPPPAGSVTITGTVSGTVIKVVRADTKAILSQTDTAPLTGPPFPYPFTLSNIPVGLPIEIFFFSAGQTFPLYGGNPSTNVFTVLTAGPIDLGFVTMGAGRATPQNQPMNVTLGVEDLSPLPPGIEPPPATLTVATPAPATGSVIVDFAVQNFTIGGQGQQHLHIQVDTGAIRHFYNGQTNAVLDDSNKPTTDVRRQSATSFRLDGLAPGQYFVTVKLSTASHNEFVNQEAKPAVVPITISNPPTPPETLTITSPAPQNVLPSGPVLVSFTVQNFTIGDPGSSHLHIYLDGGTTANHFFNGTTDQVLDGNGQPVATITWQSITLFQITGFSNGSHTIRLRLADGAEQELQSAEAIPPDLIITIQAPPSPPTMTIISPAPSAPPLPTGPVLVTFDIQNSPVPPSDTQPRMYFFVDGDPTPYKFYDGPGILEDGSSSGVRYLGVHTHFVHWKSGNSIQLNALASGSHEVKFVLVDLNEAPLPGTEKTLAFGIAAGAGGVFSLQEVVGGLNVPVAMATSPDGGTIFVNEQITGNIRVVTPTTTLPWQLQAVPFAALPPPFNSNGREQGLLGIAVDPSFSANHYVYVYYTADAPTAPFRLKNRVVRLTATTDSNKNTVADISTLLVILDDIPANFAHNGGIIHFGPDGMLYIIVGENEVASDAQDLTSLRGKILRIKPDGTIPSDNPFFNTLQAPFSAIYSLGHRNSFGFTFHPHTNDLWETENGTDANDEINRILAGGNYGWPLILGIGNDPNCPNCINPVWSSGTTRFAPTGIVAFREDSVYPAQYHNNLLFADFNFGQLHRIVLGGAGLTDFVSHTIACDCGQGGLIAVMHGLNVPGQDGYIYVSNATGSILRVVPP